MIGTRDVNKTLERLLGVDDSRGMIVVPEINSDLHAVLGTLASPDRNLGEGAMKCMKKAIRIGPVGHPRVVRGLYI